MVNRSGVVRLRDIALGLLIFTTVLAGMLNFMGGVFNEYSGADYDNSTLEGIASDTADKSDTITTQARNRSLQVQGSQSLLDVGGFFISTIYQLIKLPLTAYTVIQATAATLLSEFGFGSNLWPVTLVVGFISIIIGYEVVTLYRGVRT